MFFAEKWAEIFTPCDCGSHHVYCIDPFELVFRCADCGNEMRPEDEDGLDPVELLYG